MSGAKVAVRKSAGILLHRSVECRTEVLLVHPGAPFWRNKDIGAWQIPKGQINPGENDEAAARREVTEELGCEIGVELVPLGEIRQAGGKTVVAFAAAQDFDPSSLVSNVTEIEWPYRSGRTLSVPEVDEARWFDLSAARRHMLPSQAPFLDRLIETLSNTRVPIEMETTMNKLSADRRDDLDKGAFAFPKGRKEPLENASHVRNAIARFNQVKDVSDDERDAAWKRIKAAAKKHGVEVHEKSWREIGRD